MLFVTTIQEAAPERRPPLPEREHTDHQAAALWLSKAITLADVNKRPWLRDLVRDIFNGPQQRMVRGSPNTKKSTALPGAQRSAGRCSRPGRGPSASEAPPNRRCHSSPALRG